MIRPEEQESAMLEIYVLKALCVVLKPLFPAVWRMARFPDRSRLFKRVSQAGWPSLESIGMVHFPCQKKKNLAPASLPSAFSSLT